MQKNDAGTGEIHHRMAQFMPGLARLRELRHASVLKNDIIAGIAVALLLIPQSMAFAQLAGLPVQVGLYAALLPPLVASLFGSSRQLVTGPVSLISLMTFAAVTPLAQGDAQKAAELAMLLALLVGLVQLGLGLLRLGVLVDFLSHPVVTGFTNAAVIIIASAQMDKLFGVSAQKGEWHLQTVWNTLQAMAQGVHWPTVLMATFGFAVVIGVRRWQSRLPAVLVAVTLTTFVSWLTSYADLGGMVVGEVPAALPRLALPPLDVHAAATLLPAAIVIALLGYLESVSIARALAARTRQRLSANQELFGQGAANLSAAFSGAYPVAGSFSRSAVNLDNGARTPFAAVITSAMVAITLLFLTPLLQYLPQATLAVVIIVAVAGLFQVKPIIRAWRVQRHDGIAAVATFLLTLLAAPRLEVGIFGGILLSVALFIYRTMRPRVSLLVRLEDGRLGDAHLHPHRPRCPKVLLVRQYMLLYFANAGHFEHRLLQLLANHPETCCVVLDFSAVNMIDDSGIEALSALVGRLRDRGIRFSIARANHHVTQALRRAGLVTEDEEDETDGIRLFHRPTEAICHALAHIRCPHCDDGIRCPLRRKDFNPGPCP